MVKIKRSEHLERYQVQGFTGYQEFMETLNADCNVFSELAENTADLLERNRSRRAFARAVSVSIDAITSSFAALLLVRDKGLNHAEVAVLSEVGYELNGDEAVPVRRWAPARDRTKFVLKVFARVFDIAFSDSGWRALQDSLSVRHRVTHPKVPEDILVADAEFDVLREAQLWLNMEFSLLMP